MFDYCTLVWHIPSYTELPSSDQESKPTIDVKPKLEPPSPPDEKPTLSELKTEPVSPDKKDIKAEQVKLDSEQGEDFLLKEIARLRHIVMGYQETVQMYRKSLQGNYTGQWLHWVFVVRI